MKLPRPYIPLHIRLAVTQRMLKERKLPVTSGIPWTMGRELEAGLNRLFDDISQVHLDHDPPLMNRQKLYDGTKHVAYSPPANDPDFLIYRKARDHKIKTFVRGDGALRSDVAQRRYLKRVEANRKPKKKFKPRRAKHIRRAPHAPVTTR